MLAGRHASAGVCVEGGRGRGGAAAAARHRPLGGSSLVAAAGLAAVVWWGLPRLYGGAHTKTTQMDRHGQGAESGEWMRTVPVQDVSVISVARLRMEGWIQKLSKTRGISEGFHLAHRCGRAPKLEQFPNLLIACGAEF